MSDKVYLGQPRTIREVNANTFAGGFVEYRADADQLIGQVSGDTTYWGDAVAPREATFPFFDAGQTNRFTALQNMHLMGALNVHLTWSLAPSAGDTVKVKILSSYATPDDWIAEMEIGAPGNATSMAFSIAILDFIPQGEYWEITVNNNTDQDLLFNGKLGLYRIG